MGYSETLILKQRWAEYSKKYYGLSANYLEQEIVCSMIPDGMNLVQLEIMAHASLKFVELLSFKEIYGVIQQEQGE